MFAVWEYLSGRERLGEMESLVEKKILVKRYWPVE